MKVLMITEFYPPCVFGGGEISCKRLVEELRKQGHEVDVLSFNNTGTIKRLLLKYYVKKSLKNTNYDMYHFYGTTPKIKINKPNVTTINNTLLFHPTGYLQLKFIMYLIGWFRMKQLQLSFKKNDTILCVSNYIKKVLEQRGFTKCITMPSIK